MVDCLTVANASVCVVDHTTAGADLLQVNRSCADALGYDRDVLAGRPLEVRIASELA